MAIIGVDLELLKSPLSLEISPELSSEASIWCGENSREKAGVSCSEDGVVEIHSFPVEFRRLIDLICLGTGFVQVFEIWIPERNFFSFSLLLSVLCKTLSFSVG